MTHDKDPSENDERERDSSEGHRQGSSGVETAARPSELVYELPLWRLFETTDDEVDADGDVGDDGRGGEL